MKIKYFVISDIHGHFDEMLFALNEKGYDPENENYHLIVIGDMFDRGDQSIDVLEYLYDLHQAKKATIILGNHDNFLIELLNGEYSKAYFNLKHNGLAKTIESLTNKKTGKMRSLKYLKQDILDKYPYLHNWLLSLPLFYELGDFIFAHGGIDNKNGDWRNNSRRDFIWSKEIELDRIEGKTVVCGHHRVPCIRFPKEDYKKLFKKHPEAFDILRLDGKILIDGYVEVSKRINVLILEL